jgi:acyl-homoserine-lactone acylase
MNRFLLLLAICWSQLLQAQVDPRRVTIARDSFGVPHIFAATDPEVAYGLAWANAEDDFKSMQEVILPAKGKMGRVMGKAGAAGDYAFHLFRCREITEERWHTLSPAFLRLLEGYVQGINEYALQHRNQWLEKQLFPVTVKEYVAASVLALVVFNGADDALKRIFSNRIWTVPDYSTQKGSNSAAVRATHTTTGESFLMVNAHQPNTGSQAFYEAHVCSEEGWNALGGLLAGGPCILHGVNEFLGWAHTVNYCDRTDVFQLQMHPQKPNYYRFDEQWVELEQKKIRLRIKGIPIPVKRTVYWSRYGATMKNKQGVFSIRLGANMRIGALQQWYEMNKARSFSEFYKVLQQQELSMFNIMYADRNDTIFYINNALMPVRDTQSVYQWRKTVPGNTSRTLWTNFRTLPELPQYINPSSGFLFNTNHSSFAATNGGANLRPSLFSKTDGWEMYHNNRSVRFLELVPKDGKWTMEQFRRVKFDKQYPARFQFIHNIDSLYQVRVTGDAQLDSVLLAFRNWNRQSDTSSVGAGIFFLLYEQVVRLMDGQDARRVTLQEGLRCFEEVRDYLVKHFGKVAVTLGELQRLVRGNRSWALWGLPDQLSPQWTAPYQNGTKKSIGGDGYIMFIRFAKDSLPQIETVNMYGASSVPGTPHFDDQVPFYLRQQTKKMTLRKEDVLKAAARVYYPGQQQ